MFNEEEYELSEYWYTISPINELERNAALHGQLPPCLESGRNDCGECILEDTFNCPVKMDQDFASLLLYRRDQHLLYIKKQQERISALKYILRKHKVPLHWEHLGILALRQSPNLFGSLLSIKSVVYSNEGTFYVDSNGIVKLKL